MKIEFDGNQSVSNYLKQTLITLDGQAWILTCIGSLICLFDIWFGFNFIPLGNSNKSGKATILLLSSPLIIFLFLINLRQLPFGSYTVSMWIRSAICLFSFVIINF